jgi:hypothetical protein
MISGTTPAATPTAATEMIVTRESHCMADRDAAGRWAVGGFLGSAHRFIQVAVGMIKAVGAT